jgi:hypothetical protein
MTEFTPATLLDCASRGDLAGYAAAIAAIPVNRLNTVGKDETFQESVRRLVPIALKGSSPLKRLNALALIGRADSTTQQKQPAIGDAARAAVGIEPPALGAEAQDKLTPDDRYYVALAVARGDPSWATRYAARALVEESGEPRIKNDVRAVFAAQVFNDAMTLADAFRLIASAVPGSLHEDPKTKTAELSRAKRITKLLPSIDDAARRTLRDSGEGLSEAFNAMMQMLVFRYSRPMSGLESDEISAGVANAVLLLLGTLVRTRFSIAVETESYKSVGRLQSWLKTRAWPANISAARNRLGQSLIEAIAVRASMGNASRELFQVLIQLTGHRTSAAAQLVPLADRPGVPAEVQDWLRAGGVQPPPRFESAASDESGLRDVDTLVASTFLRARRLTALVEGEAKSALIKVRELPEIADVARQLTQTFNFARALANDCAAVARRRSMITFGTVGEKVIVEPKRHRQPDGALIETEQARVDVPGVERTLPNGTVEVIMPAIVTPLETKRK